MKREEIEELHEYLRIGAADTTMPVSFLAPRVLRLLAERKALLEALRDCPRPRTAKALDALALAES